MDIIKGKTWTFGENIDTDVIIPGRYLRTFNPQDLADHVSLNPTYLATVFKKETGLTIATYIMRRRIDTACNMLRYSEYSASQISEILAFSSQSYFIRCFKQIKGMTPYEYVQRHSEENIEAARKKDLNRSADSVYARSESETTPPSPSGTK